MIKDTTNTNICENCNKQLSTKYNLKRHLDTCNKIIFQCEYCDINFSRKSLLLKHYDKCKCKELKEQILELTKKIIELENIIYKNNIVTNNNIDINDINIKNFSIFDILEYGTSIGLFICNNSILLKKIKFKNKRKNIIEYNINNICYNDKGIFLIQFIINILKNKIIEFIENKYDFIDSNNILYNEHTKRLLNIKNTEIDEIINKKKNNNLYKEIFTIILDNLV